MEDKKTADCKLPPQGTTSSHDPREKWEERCWKVELAKTIKKESKSQLIWVVTIDTLKYFDECQRSFLPEFHKVFGVYRTKDEAMEGVHSTFYNKKGEYEPIFDGLYMYNAPCHYDEAFKYEDKEYGGIAIYGVEYHLLSLKDESKMNEKFV